MTDENIQILVLLRETCDPRPPARVTADGAAIRERGLRRIVNPADLVALEQALALADSQGAGVTAVAVGPDRLDDSLRLALAMGASRAIRVWDPGFRGADAVAEARVLTRVVEVLKPALLFTGHRLLDRGNDPAPALAAANLGIPYLTATVALTLQNGGLEVLRKGDRGARLKVAAPCPAAVFFEDGSAEPRYPDHEAVLRSLEATIEPWGLPELGLPFWELGGSGALLAQTGYRFPRPNPLRVVTPDAGLPAYDRILALLSGGIRPREGRMHFGTAQEVADALFKIFHDEGLIGEGPR